MVKYTIGPKVRKGAGASTREASPDDPIYTRGFSIGQTRSNVSSIHMDKEPQPRRPNGQPETITPLRERDMEDVIQAYERMISELAKDMDRQEREQRLSLVSTSPAAKEPSSTDDTTEKD